MLISIFETGSKFKQRSIEEFLQSFFARFLSTLTYQQLLSMVQKYNRLVDF